MTDESQISEREREILQLVATGATNQQIAQQLNISVNTVKVHLRNIFGKIGVVSRTEATLYAVRSGLVTVERASSATAIADEPEELAAEPAPLASAGLPPAPVEPPPSTPIAVAPPAPAPPRQPANTLVIGLAAVALLAVGTLIVTLLMRPAPPAPAAQTPATPELPAESERWRDLASLPTPLTGFALAATSFDGASYLYAIGGEGPDTISGDVLRYDVAGDTWVRFSPKPTPVADVQAAVVAGRVYVPGGRTPDGQISAVLESYDPQRDSWSTLAPLPAPRSRYGLTAVEGKLYLLGGWDGSTYAADVWQYSPDTNNWAALTPMSSPRADMGTVAFDGQIYLIGGENASGPVARHERYNPAEEGQDNPWTIRAPLPAPRSRMAATVVSDRIFLLGGNGDTISYDVSRDQWQPTPPTPLDPSLSGLRAQSFGTRLYIVGGQSADGPRANAYEYLALFTVMVPIS